MLPRYNQQVWWYASMNDGIIRWLGTVIFYTLLWWRWWTIEVYRVNLNCELQYITTDTEIKVYVMWKVLKFLQLLIINYLLGSMNTGMHIQNIYEYPEYLYIYWYTVWITQYSIHEHNHTQRCVITVVDSIDYCVRFNGFHTLV